MSGQAYFNLVTSESSYRSRFAAEQGKHFFELNDVSASGWDRQNLLACRVIRRPKRDNLLPTLSRYSSPPNFPTEIINFIEGPTEPIRFWSEHRLVHTNGPSLGQLWAALAALTSRGETGDAPDGLDEGSQEEDSGARLKRVRRNTLQHDLVDSSMIQVGSSSPVADQDSQGSSSVGYVDEDSQASPILLEDNTLRLASCVIRHILFFAPPQNSDSLPYVIEFRDAKTRLAASTPHKRKVVAVDDGGLFLREESTDRIRIVKEHVAVLEAKKRFQCIENGRPVISDSCFAQMTFEALATRLSQRREDSNESVIVINFTRHYVCLLQFEISAEFLQDFESTAPKSFINVYSTPWFDISSKRGRENLVANVCRLMAWAMDT